MSPHHFEKFLEAFIPTITTKSKQLNKAYWLLETTGSSDAADLKAELDAEYRMLFQDAKTYQQLLAWDEDVNLKSPLLKRQLNVLIREFKQNQIPKSLVEEIANKEAALAQTYSAFRPMFEGKTITENEILSILKTENDPKRRQQVWKVSKEIGTVLAPQILNLVELRNQAAKRLGYSDYFQMQLDLQEVNDEWLSNTLQSLMEKSDMAYSKVLSALDEAMLKRFCVSKENLGPWSFGDPFCQCDPLDLLELDSLVEGVDIPSASKRFYDTIGIDVQSVLDRSDMFERPGKNQHAFCINMDREKDVRTLNNVEPSIKWLETVLHELGHAVYELGFDDKLPWLLRAPPHMITTEAMALLAGRQAYRHNALLRLVGNSKEKELLMKNAEASLQRRQLIFSRWVLVMTAFERELYRNPTQDLNALWWDLVARFQKISPPKDRAGKHDWAAKYHIGLAPVYYFSYLLGEMFASEIEEMMSQTMGSSDFVSSKVGTLLQQKLFAPGNSLCWSALIEHVTGKPLQCDAWIKQFCDVNADQIICKLQH